MPSYFKPPRRKIGVLTLVMACVFMAAWVRSLNDSDSRMCPWLGILPMMGDVVPYVVLTPHTFTLMTEESEGAAGYIGWVHHPTNPLDDQDITWSWRYSGFAFGERQAEIGNIFTYADGTTKTHPPAIFRYRSLPYWSIVIPLTLFSAWLLLSKPRTKKPPEST